VTDAHQASIIWHYDQAASRLKTETYWSALVLFNSSRGHWLQLESPGGRMFEAPIRDDTTSPDAPEFLERCTAFIEGLLFERPWGVA